MYTNGSSTRLVFGLAIFGLGLVVAGVQLYQRHRADIANKPSEDEIDIKARTNKNEMNRMAAVSATPFCARPYPNI